MCLRSAVKTADCLQYAQNNELASIRKTIIIQCLVGETKGLNKRDHG